MNPNPFISCPPIISPSTGVKRRILENSSTVRVTFREFTFRSESPSIEETLQLKSTYILLKQVWNWNTFCGADPLLNDGELSKLLDLLNLAPIQEFHIFGRNTFPKEIDILSKIFISGVCLGPTCPKPLIEFFLFEKLEIQVIKIKDAEYSFAKNLMESYKAGKMLKIKKRIRNRRKNQIEDVENGEGRAVRFVFVA
ncbi:hypothetical protein L596_009572 [Steinernema carpocapsae]|uniref:Uncharacterized protein n=1 Tax=Steinernema carpocapsae TaxID=34508 RepID=A0A4U5PFR0_STECR|nr:hypothetical protein L596_009572 [Steinernema carpocapsae]